MIPPAASPPRNQPLPEYEALASAWLRYCTGPAAETESEREPLGVLLLSGLCESAIGTDKLTGDVLADVLGGVALIAGRWRAGAIRGGGGVAEVELDELHTFERRINLALELRRREKGGAL